MIDLTNKNVDEINALIQKYANALEILRPDIQPYMAIIIDIAVVYIKEKYPELSTDWKAWTVVMLKKELKHIKTEADVKKLIDEFVEYYNAEYQKYCDDLGLYSSEADRDSGFINHFIHKKNR